jgi:hypothetical protein
MQRVKPPPRHDAADKVIDGSVANSARWVSSGKRGVTDGGDPHRLILEFDQPVEFDQVRLLTGYGHIQDELCVQHIRRPQTFSPQQVIAEGELRVRMMRRQADR